MGPLPSQARPASSDYRIFASFCSSKPSEGAKTSNWIEYYNPSDNTWHYVGAIPGLADNHVLKGFAIVAVGQHVYVIGGRLCRKQGSDDEEAAEMDVVIESTVRRYNVQTNDWSECAPLSTPRFDFACTVCGDKIYVAGGKSAFDCARGICSSEVYDPVADEWESLPDMSRLRYKCVGVTWQGKIYVVGGFAARKDSDDDFQWTERSSVELFDAGCGRWELNLGMWQLDIPPNQIVAIDDKLYSSGDCLNTWKGHIEAYDGNVNLWKMVEQSRLQNFSSPLDATVDAAGQQIQNVYLTMAPIEGHLYFLAGYRRQGEKDDFSFMSAVHRFDTLADGEAWSSNEPWEEQGDKQLCSHCCVGRFS